MKQRVLGKTTLFHPLLKNKEKKSEKAQNSVVLNDIVGLHLPLDARRRGRKSICSPASVPLPLSLLKPKQTQ
jgi:hypothetical protein